MQFFPLELMFTEYSKFTAVFASRLQHCRWY